MPPRVDVVTESLIGDITAILNESLSHQFIQSLQERPYQWNDELIQTLLTIIHVLVGKSVKSMDYMLVPLELIYPIWLVPKDEDDNDNEPVWVISLPFVQRMLYGYDSICVEIEDSRKRPNLCNKSDKYTSDNLISNDAVLEKLAMLVALAQFGAALYLLYKEQRGNINFDIKRNPTYINEVTRLRKLISTNANKSIDEYIHNVVVPRNFKKQRILYS